MSQNAPPDQAIHNLPVWRSVTFAYASLFGNLRHLPAALAAPLLMSVALAVIFLNFSLETAQNPGAGGQFLSFVMSLLGNVPFIIFAVAWYRLLLLGPEKAAPSFLPSWRARHWKIFGYTLALILIFFAAVTILGAILMVLTASLVGFDAAALESGGPFVGVLVLVAIAGFVAVYWFFLRFSFIFPALSVDEDYGLGHAWRHSKGQGLRLLAASLLVQMSLLPLGMLFLVLVMPSIAPDLMQAPGTEPQFEAAGQFFLALSIVANIINYLWIALMAGLLAFAFRTCTGWVPELPGSGQSGGPPPGSTIDRLV